MRVVRFRLFRVRSPLLAESLLFSFPSGTEMVHFPEFASPAYEFSRRYGGFARRGFPHSEIPGSQPVCGSPRLIAACRVLPRLSAPRHPPYALSSLTIKLTQDPARGLPGLGRPAPEPRPTMAGWRCGSGRRYAYLLLCPKTSSSIQLSKISGTPERGRPKLVVGLGGVEPPTSPLSGVRSSHLSYRPKSRCWWS